MVKQVGPAEFVPPSCKTDQSMRSNLARQGFRRNWTVYEGYDAAGDPLLEMPEDKRTWRFFAINRKEKND